MSPTEDKNLYQTPQSALGSSKSAEKQLSLLDRDGKPYTAGAGVRVLTLLLDYVIYLGLSMIGGMILAIIAMLIGSEKMLEFISSEGGGYVIAFPIYIGYYIIMEAAFGRTIGKLACGTRVVNQHGRKASVGQIFGRTFCRFIPFEAFSFLGSETRGWHDSIAKTYVINVREQSKMKIASDSSPR